MEDGPGVPPYCHITSMSRKVLFYLNQVQDEVNAKGLHPSGRVRPLRVYSMTIFEGEHEASSENNNQRRDDDSKGRNEC